MATKAILGADTEDDDALDFLGNMTMSIRKKWKKWINCFLMLKIICWNLDIKLIIRSLTQPSLYLSYLIIIVESMEEIDKLAVFDNKIYR